MSIVKDAITSEHPLYKRRKAQWERDERRYKGGSAVAADLIPFAWESDQAAPALSEKSAMETLARQSTSHTRSHYEQRQITATYPSFARRMTEKFVGRLAADAPKPGEGYDFGGLGQVREIQDLTPPMTRAEMLYYNCDRQGSPLVAWFNEVQRQAMNTGHRWVGVTAPPVKGTMTKDQEQEGLRPYLTHFSPLDVPNWDLEAGVLNFIVINVAHRQIVGKGGQYSGEAVNAKLLYVRKGYNAFGDEYSGGGWWMFDADGALLKDAEGNDRTGTLEKTGGVIPYTPFFYEQDKSEMSRGGTAELNNISASYMNISSAGDNDAIEAGGRTLYLLGVSQQGHNLASEVKQAGSRHVPVPANDAGQIPQVYDTGSVSASAAIEEALKRKKREAAHLANDELTRSPDASGVARQIEFLEIENPRLALMAFNREAAENRLLGWACGLWGLPADAGVAWPKSYDLETTVEDWERLFEAAERMGVQSPTLAKRGLQGIAREKNLAIEKDDWEAIESEIDEAMDQKAQEESIDNLDVFT